MFYESGNVDGDWEVHNIGTYNSIGDNLSKLATLITNISKKNYKNEIDKQSVIENVRGIGATLYSRYIPDELRNRIQDWASETALAISTNEQWIPWELFYDGIEFWGNRFFIFRLPRLPRLRRTSSITQPATRGAKMIEFNKIMHVAGGDIPAQYIEQALKYFDELDSKTVVKILKARPLSRSEKVL